MAAQKKRWFKIQAPGFFRDRIVGETPAFEASQIEGKTLKVNLFTLTDNMKRQNTEVTLLVTGLSGDLAKTRMIGLRLIPASLRRLIRKGRTRLDSTLKVITKDEKIVTLKPLLVTRNTIQGKVFTSIQHECKRFILKAVSTTNFDDLSQAIVEGRLQRDLRQRLSKIYPLRTCDIRDYKLERFLKDVDIRKIKAALERAKKGLPEQVPEEEIEEVAEEQSAETSEQELETSSDKAEAPAEKAPEEAPEKEAVASADESTPEEAAAEEAPEVEELKEDIAELKEETAEKPKKTVKKKAVKKKATKKKVKKE